MKPTPPKPISPWSYPVKWLADGGEERIDALDAPIAPAWYVDEQKMCATGLLATAARDREGDVFEVSGLDVTDHRRNPVVFIDHGLWYRLPIGKTEDEGGNYTVVVDEKSGDCYQTTYFSQKSQMAEQVFHLCAEKILRANSIGYRPITWKPIPPDPERGVPAGKHLLTSKLVEVTWCGVPMNQDAVMACLSRDKICGKSILPEIKHLLSPYIQSQKTQIYIPGKTMDEAPVDDVKDADTDVEGAEDGPSDAAEPLGKVLLRDMGDGLRAVVDAVEKNLGACEMGKVNKLIGKHLDGLKGMCKALEDMHEAVYGGGKDGDEPGADDDEAPADEADDREDAAGGDAKGSKALLRSLLGDKNLTPSQRHIVRAAVKAWAAGAVEDEDAEEDPAEVARLERAIARRVAMVANLV